MGMVQSKVNKNKKQQRLIKKILATEQLKIAVRTTEKINCRLGQLHSYLTVCNTGKH